MTDASTENVEVEVYRPFGVLGRHMPHTPSPDGNDPMIAVLASCLPPSEGVKGCEAWSQCPLHEIKGRTEAPCGPVQVVVETHGEGHRPGEGRRFPQWCFAAARNYGKRNGKLIDQSTTILWRERVYESIDENGDIKRHELLPIEESGPHYRAGEAQKGRMGRMKVDHTKLAEFRARHREQVRSGELPDRDAYEPGPQRIKSNLPGLESE